LVLKTDPVDGGVAQLGERLPCTQEVIGSIPFTSTIIGYIPYKLAPNTTSLYSDNRDMKNNKLIKKLAKTYVEYCRQHDGKFQWNDSEVSAHLEAGDVSKLEIMHAVADLCTTDNELSNFVIASLLQDLLYNPPESLSQDIKTAVQISPALRRALQMLYLPPNTKARRLIEEILTESGLVYGVLASQEYPYEKKVRSNAHNLWAWHWFHDHPPELKIVCLFMDNCKKDEDLIHFARGPFAKLIQQGGEAILSELDSLAWKSKRVRRALCGVVVEPETPAEEVMDHLLLKYKLTYNSL
jgi:hypothetical protein